MEKTRYIQEIGRVTIKTVEYHRNGVWGQPFNVVTFTQKNGHKNQNMIAILFVDSGGNCAVFDTDLLGQGNIAFGKNSWRGDIYEKEMRKVVEEYWDEVSLAEQRAKQK